MPKISIEKNSNLSLKESLALLNDIKDMDNLEYLLIFYLLFIKGLNFTLISRILLTSFKKGFNYLIIKKGTHKKYKIDKLMQPKFFEFMKSKVYISKYFFFNEIIDEKKGRRVAYIKEKFKQIIDNCTILKIERKEKIITLFSSIRNVKWSFNLRHFLNDIGYTLGYFSPEFRIFSQTISDKTEEKEIQSLLSSSDKYENTDINNQIKNITPQEPESLDFEYKNKNLLKTFENEKYLKDILLPQISEPISLSESKDVFFSISDFSSSQKH